MCGYLREMDKEGDTEAKTDTQKDRQVVAPARLPAWPGNSAFPNFLYTYVFSARLPFARAQQDSCHQKS